MENIKINNQIFEIKNNVKSQSCNISTSKLFFEYYDSNQSNNLLSFFLLFETWFDCTFGHWLYESAIYLSYFFELKSRYPELKILVKKNPKRNYKKLFFKALNINDNDIYWLDNEEINDCKTVYINIPSNNICINTKPHYLNTVQIKDKNIFKELIIKFKNILIDNLNITYPSEKFIQNLFFKRSKIENYSCRIKQKRDLQYIEKKNIILNMILITQLN